MYKKNAFLARFKVDLYTFCIVFSACLSYILDIEKHRVFNPL